MPLLHVTSLQDGNLAAPEAEELLLPRGLLCFLPGGCHREKCWWESLSFTLLTKISASDSVPSTTKNWSHFPFLAPCGCSEHPRLSLHQPAPFPTAWLTRPSSLLSAHARVTKAVSRVLRYIYFWRTFHLGSQEVRVQIFLLQP